MGNKDQEITTIDSLTAAFPELVQKVQESAVEAAKGKLEADAKKAEQERILELIGIQFNEDQSGKLKSVIESGVSAEQFKAIKSLNPKADAGDQETDEERQARQKALDAIAGAGAEDPGAGDGGAGKKDYMVLVEEYMAAHNVPRLKAMQAVNRSHPKEREEFINKQNPHLAKTG